MHLLSLWNILIELESLLKWLAWDRLLELELDNSIDQILLIHLKFIRWNWWLNLIAFRLNIRLCCVSTSLCHYGIIYYVQGNISNNNNFQGILEEHDQRQCVTCLLKVLAVFRYPCASLHEFHENLSFRHVLFHEKLIFWY